MAGRKKGRGGGGKMKRARGNGELLMPASITYLRNAQRYLDNRALNGPVKVLVKDGRPVTEGGQTGGPTADPLSPFVPHSEDFEGWVGGIESDGC